ncbi:MAG: peptidylprolyl isomerase [Marinilabiliales bacterium]|nr:MAG: peptidylprolyl isomerase [Marinilabiliales bacterium]
MLKYLPLLLICVSYACSGTTNDDGDKRIVRVETVYGNMDIMLFNETPLHRDNFIKLIEDGFYEDLLFHRVIDNFMIQGGDPVSRNATGDTQPGSGGPGYTIPAEIHDHLYHRKGALAAARLGDNVNPDRESSGSQFYIVHGSLFTDQQLDEMEQRIQAMEEHEFTSRNFRRLEKEYLDRDEVPDYAAIASRIEELGNEYYSSGNHFKFSDEMRESYTTVGGAPHLDGSYTVFGQVIEGFEVIDKIASVETNSAARPREDIKMNIRVIR